MTTDDVKSVQEVQYAPTQTSKTTQFVDSMASLAPTPGAMYDGHTDRFQISYLKLNKFNCQTVVKYVFSKEFCFKNIYLQSAFSSYIMF